MSEKFAYLLAGGPSTTTEQLTADFRTAFQNCEATNPSVAYIGTANQERENSFLRIKEPLLVAGAGEVILVPVINANADEAKRILSSADVVFLSGGEVEDGMFWLKQSGLDIVLTDLFNSGKLFLGISAGSIMMGKYWVHWDIENDDSTSSLFECLGFIPRTFDTHMENENWREMECALRLLGPDSEGCGLSDGGFYRADSGGNLTVLRNEPIIFRNTGTEILRQTGGYSDEG